MNRTPSDTLSSLNLLSKRLDGSFTARAASLLASEFALLDRNGGEFGRLRLAGVSRAELSLEDHTVTFEASRGRVRMVADGEEVLTGHPKQHRSADELDLSCDGRSYKARFSFFRNRAAAFHPGNERAVHLSGSLTGRRYEALLHAGDVCALPVAALLLWHLTASRRRAYLAGLPAGGGEI